MGGLWGPLGKVPAGGAGAKRDTKAGWCKGGEGWVSIVGAGIRVRTIDAATKGGAANEKKIYVQPECRLWIRFSKIKMKFFFLMRRNMRGGGLGVFAGERAWERISGRKERSHQDRGCMSWAEDKPQIVGSTKTKRKNPMPREEETRPGGESFLPQSKSGNEQCQLPSQKWTKGPTRLCFQRGSLGKNNRCPY